MISLVSLVSMHLCSGSMCFLGPFVNGSSDSVLLVIPCPAGSLSSSKIPNKSVQKIKTERKILNIVPAGDFLL